jgi:hypothetical protein
MIRRTFKIPSAVRRATEARLRRIARIGEVFVDGDAFKGVPLKPEINTGDEYLVDHEKFLAVKQALLKLRRIEPGDIGVQLWRPFKDQADICVPVDIHPLAVRPGNHPLTPAMRRALNGRTGVQTLYHRDVPLLSVCAPLRDSLDDIVGILEVYASLVPRVLQVKVAFPGDDAGERCDHASRSARRRIDNNNK